MAYDLTPRVGDSAHRLLFKIAAATSDVDDPPNPDAPENQLLRRIAAATAAGAGGSGGGAGGLPDNYITGFAVSATHQATSYTVTAGVCRDSTNSHDIQLTAPMTKLLATTWAAGTGNGGYRAGESAPSASLPIAVYVIKNTSTGDVDIWHARTTTNIAANLPSGYTVFRRVGWCWPNSSTQLNGLATEGDYSYVLTAASLFPQAGSLTVTTSEQAQAILAPPNCHVQVGVQVYHATTAGYIRITGGDSLQYNTAPNSASGGSTQNFGGSATTGVAQVYHLLTNASRQIRLRSSQTSTSVYYWVIGWRDPRGA